MGILDRIKSLLTGGGIRVNALEQAAVGRTVFPGSSSRQPATIPAQPREDILVTEEYEAVLQAISAGAPVVFVSGKAGTGKSTLIQWLLGHRRWQSAVVAPTGIAALNVGGQTIHSFFRLPPRLIERDDIRRITDRTIFKHLQLLIVDEISMVRADLMDAIGWFLEINGPKSGSPFGGVQLLLVGDLFQLPPVVDHKDLLTFFRRVYRSPHFFSAKVLKEASIVPIELDRVFRQSDPTFSNLLNQIREGKQFAEAVAELNSRCYVDAPGRWSGYSITLTPTNRAADARNSSALHSLVGPSRTYSGQFRGHFDTNGTRLPSPQNLELRVGAQVMFTKNGGPRWVNGTLGVVRGLKEDCVQVELPFSPSRAVVDVHPATWDSFQYRWHEESVSISKVAVGQYVQIPLMLAWATTIHKSQGKTIDSVEVDFDEGTFAPGQAYVALSRCRDIENLRFTRPIRKSDVQIDPEIIRFYEELRRLAGDAR